MRMIKVIWIIAIMIVSVISVKPTVPPSSSPTTPPTTHTPTTQTITPTQGPTLPTRSPVVPLYLPDTAFERFGLLCSLLPAIDPHLIFLMYRSYTPITENKFVSFNTTSRSFIYHPATWGTWASSYSNNYYFTQKPTGVKLYLGGGLSFASYNLEQSPPKLTVESDSLFSGVDAGLCLLAITVEDNDYLIAFGGYGGTRRTLGRVFRVFDVSTQLEEPRRPSYQTARHSFTCHVVNNTFLYIIGGSVKYSSSGVHDTIEVLELPRPTDQMSSIDEVTGSWQYMKVRLLKPRAGHSSVVHAHGSSIVVFGGVITAEQYNWNVEIIDIVHQTVSYGGDSVYTGRYPCVVSVPPYIYKFGGYTGRYLTTYETYPRMINTMSPTLEPTQAPTDTGPPTTNPSVPMITTLTTHSTPSDSSAMTSAFLHDLSTLPGHFPSDSNANVGLMSVPVIISGVVIVVLVLLICICGCIFWPRVREKRVKANVDFIASNQANDNMNRGSEARHVGVVNVKESKSKTTQHTLSLGKSKASMSLEGVEMTIEGEKKLKVGMGYTQEGPNGIDVKKTAISTPSIQSTAR
eukprot:669600_1